MPEEGQYFYCKRCVAEFNDKLRAELAATPEDARPLEEPKEMPIRRGPGNAAKQSRSSTQLGAADAIRGPPLRLARRIRALTVEIFVCGLCLLRYICELQ